MKTVGKKRTRSAFNFNALASLSSLPPYFLPGDGKEILDERLSNGVRREGTSVYLNKRLMHYHLNKVL